MAEIPRTPHVDDFPAICTAFADLLPYAILTLDGIAALLNCTPETIRRAWHRGDLPRPFQLPNNRHGWFVRDILLFWEHNRVSPKTLQDHVAKASRPLRAVPPRQKKRSPLRDVRHAQKG